MGCGLPLNFWDVEMPHSPGSPSFPIFAVACGLHSCDVNFDETGCGPAVTLTRVMIGTYLLAGVALPPLQPVHQALQATGRGRAGGGARDPARGLQAGAAAGPGVG